VSARNTFEYAVVRVVPRVEREEFVNCGVILLCNERQFLGTGMHLDEARVLALWPATDLAVVRDHLEGFAQVCAGGAAAGPLGHLGLRERFRWLVAPRSTILQTGAPHGGLCDEPAVALDRLLDRLVRLHPVDE
jgi:hypothetical protein